MANTAVDMAYYRPQDPQQVTEMLRGLHENTGKGSRKGGFSCKKSHFKVDNSNLGVDSWKMQDWDYKKANLPTYARGLFTTTRQDGRPEIAVRGYDKFFNVDEVRDTAWANVERDTRGSYALSVKENGCIIFLAGLEDGTLIVCSKHSTGSRGEEAVSHAKVGEKWVDKHVASVGKTRHDLAGELREMNATAVAELCDDDFEEHVLAYSPNSAGLYLHGINLNLPEFATYPHHMVDRFAEQWGFRRTTYVVKDNINEVKTFLDGVAETGHYDGRDTEGFVVRCQSKAGSGHWHDWFFKYKFEEPYLMYRQWRECTKAIIAGKQPKYKKHKKITEEYLTFARQQLQANPSLADAYQRNHGIIKMRDDFLAYRGLRGSDIIRQEAAEGEVSGDAVTKDVVLVTVATIGCGKTTVALALAKLFGWGHVQNDNITVKKNKPFTFATACASSLAVDNAIIADRNNHQKRERKQLIEDVSRILPNAHFVCLQWVHDRHNWDRIRKATRDRVLNRGDNHQTIQSSKGSEEIIGIMEGFLHRFEPVNPSSSPDDAFDNIIDLDVGSSSRDNLETVITRLYTEYPKLFSGQEMPTSEDMDSAIDYAMKEYTVDIKHEIKSRPNGQKNNNQQRNIAANSQANGSTQPKPKEKKVEYFAVQVPTPRITSILETLFHTATPDQRRLYDNLKQKQRIQPDFHVTLIHRLEASGPHAEYWSHLLDLQAQASALPTTGSSEPPLGVCSVRLERLVFDNRVMAFVVRLIPRPESAPWRSVNAVAHITVGTSSPAIKPVESNALLARWLAEGAGGAAGAAGANGIFEVVVEGNVELEGIVRAVWQKF